MCLLARHLRIGLHNFPAISSSILLRGLLSISVELLKEIIMHISMPSSLPGESNIESRYPYPASVILTHVQTCTATPFHSPVSPKPPTLDELWTTDRSEFIVFPQRLPLLPWISLAHQRLSRNLLLQSKTDLRPIKVTRKSCSSRLRWWMNVNGKTAGKNATKDT